MNFRVKGCFVLGWLFGETALMFYSTTDVVLIVNCVAFFTTAFFVWLWEAGA